MKEITTAFLLLGACVPAFADDPVLERLNNSPRHHEWVVAKNGEREVHCFLAFPEVSEKAPAVVVIHENRGLTDWVRGVADQLAEAGYIAIAPDCLSGAGPDGGATESFGSQDAATRALRDLDPDQVIGDLNAAADYALQLDACDGTLAVAGFCWGGAQTFRFATVRPDLKAAFVFYGSAPTAPEDLAAIECPVYAFYAENDARINEGIPAAEEAMKELDKTYDHVMYDGAGHGFMRSGEAPDASEANRAARDAAWERWKELLAKMRE